MEIASRLVPPAVEAGAAILMGVLLWRAVGRLRRERALPSPHVLGALAVAVALLWAVKVTPVPGFTVHLTGAALAMLMLGAPAALMAVSAGALLAVAFGAIEWELVGLQALLHSALPVGVARAWLAGCERLFGANLFVYLLGVAFFGTSAAVLAASVAGMLAAAAAGLALPRDAWVAVVPLAYAEAFVTGGLTTLLVVYRPQWVATFDDARYLRKP